MFRHTVLLTFKDDTTDDQIGALRAALAKLPGAIPEIATYAFGSDAGINQGNASFAVTATFATPEQYVVYRDHPEHQRVVREHIVPILASRTAVQFEEASS